MENPETNAILGTKHKSLTKKTQHDDKNKRM